MRHTSQRIWGIYFVFAIILAAIRAHSFFSLDTSEHLYFSILHSFSKIFLVSYVISFLQVIISLFHCLPLALYIFGWSLGPAAFWRVMLSLRIAFDLTGNSYAQNTFISIYRSDPVLCLVTLLFFVLPYVPWYWACWRYAFRTQGTVAGPSVAGCGRP